VGSEVSRGWTQRTALLVVVAAGTLAAGCQSATERLTEGAAERALGAVTGEDVDLDVREGRMSVDTEDGSFSVGASTEVPDRIAAVAPIPAGFEPASTFEHSDDGQRGVSVSGHLANTDVAEVLDDIETAMISDGWEQMSRTNINDELLSLGLQRGDDIFNVNLIADGDEAMLTLMLLESD
jgi:hypothetical protein